MQYVVGKPEETAEDRIIIFILFIYSSYDELTLVKIA
jgi:hypothetical protein